MEQKKYSVRRASENGRRRQKAPFVQGGEMHLGAGWGNAQRASVKRAARLLSWHGGRRYLPE
ncbi:MAG: hypothetical protein ACLSB9_13305 [Hydrogeniiclostridium mannosilyticum]